MPLLTIGNRASASTTTTPVFTAFTVTARSPLLVAVTWKGTETIDFIAWNTSEMLTLLGSVPDGSGTNTLAVYGLKNPTPGTFDLQVWFIDAPASGAAIFIIGTVGGDTVTGWRSVLTQSNASVSGPGLSIDTVAGDIVFHAATVQATTITFDGGETTTSTEIDNILSTGFSSGFSTKPTSGAGDVVTVGCTDVATYSEIAIPVMQSLALNVSLNEPVIGGSVLS